jgi:uncharacterized protein YfiM (DUF2279 family)
MDRLVSLDVPKSLFSIAVFMLLLTSSTRGVGQGVDSLSQKESRKRIRWVIGSEAVLYAGTMIGLNELWYKDYERSPLHHFNDNAEWLQMDKVGHLVTSYYTGLAGMEALRWAGMDEKRSRWYGGMLGWAFLGSVELLDGYSSEWGFSSGDILANSIGAGALIGQDALWHEQRLVFKFSFRQSPYTKYRPGTLGDGWQEELLKDYNGQTYWLSANIASFLPEETTFPKWLSLGFGYGVDEVLNARGDFAYITENQSRLFQGKRQYYVGPDIDLWRIPTQRKGLKLLFKTLGFIKLPLPAVVLQDGRLNLQGFRF